jgi:hypothetical protein
VLTAVVARGGGAVPAVHPRAWGCRQQGADKIFVLPTVAPPELLEGSNTKEAQKHQDRERTYLPPMAYRAAIDVLRCSWMRSGEGTGTARGLGAWGAE